MLLATLGICRSFSARAVADITLTAEQRMSGRSGTCSNDDTLAANGSG
jgi:hypothetical protein